jgi:Glycosyltransferase Family 4
LKILITNTALSAYAGTEVVVRDLSLELKRQGHVPMVYSPRLGGVAQEIRSHGVEVSDQLTSLRAVPDIIHGHHHAQVVEALLQFPSIPAVYVCHAAAGFLEEPFYFPRLLRYVAVDDRCRKRIESVPGIPPARIEVILNAVDLERFGPRSSLPSRPERAVVFSNRASKSTHLPAVRSACKQAGLELDVVGLHAGNAVANPETILPRYDIVFAKARCALEAMAVGNAVVLCDFGGAGPMVTSKNFDRLRRLNFGKGVLLHPLKPEHIRPEIERYDALDAAAVCGRVRDEASLVQATHRWIRLYTDVIEEFRGTARDSNEEFHALGNYMRKWSYEKRMEWEREQLSRLQKVPLAGGALLHLARCILRRWSSGGYGRS